MNCLSPLRTALLASVCLNGLASAPLMAAQDKEAQAELSQPATTEREQPDSDFGSGSGEIIVSGQRLRGQLVVEQAPILSLTESDIAAEGVTSIADLVTQITNQTGSSRGRGGGGRPVILVNGIRPGSFRELFQYPPESLARVEVFPEEVAQRFGFPPDRRVINLILKEEYSSIEVEVEFEGPDRGGSHTREQELGYLTISDGARINANLTFEDTSLLTEGERDIIQTPGSISDIAGDPGQSSFRSLIADSRSMEANLSYAKAFMDSGISVSANANYERNDRLTLQGLNTVLLTDADDNSVLRTFGGDTPLTFVTASDTVAASGSLTMPVNAFRLTSTFDTSFAESTQTFATEFDTTALEDAAFAGTLALDGPLPASADAGADVARSRNLSASTLTTLRGPLADLPAGELSATFDVGYNWVNLESSDTRGAMPVDLTRGDLSSGMNLVVPITSRPNGFADALGSFTLTGQIGLDYLSDFGTLGDYTVSLNWAPFDNLDLSASYIVREVAPGLAALGNPIVVNLNQPVFDFATGDTVLADVTTGGNPNLLEETQRDWKFAANWEVPFVDGARMTVEYIRNRSDDVTAGFPQITSEIEAAFSDRITRDDDGRLLALDRRSITFAETRNDRLTFGLQLRGSIGAGQGGERGSRGGDTSGSGGNSSGERPSDAPQGGDRARGGPSADGGGRAAFVQSEAFTKLRQVACGDDGSAQLAALITQIDAGEDVSGVLPGIDPGMAQMFLGRLRGEDGSIDSERLDALRSRLCAEQDRAASEEKGSSASRASSSGGRGSGFNPLDRRRFRGFRYFVSLNHTIELKDEILIAPGLDVIDQLNGQATNAFGVPRHSTRLEAGIFGGGVGMRLSGRYLGSTRLDGSAGSNTGSLFIDDLATFDIRVFSDVGRLLGRDKGALKNLRVSLRMDNVFDARRSVVDESGVTPLNYQPFLIDPVERYIGIDIRRLF